jgi:hypothetical protein
MKMAIALLCVIPLNAFCTEELEENVSYAYPFTYDSDNAAVEENKKEKPKPKSNSWEQKSNSKSTEEESPDAWHGKLGNAKATIDAKNTDYQSQRRAEWDKIRKESSPAKDKKPRSVKERNEKEDHSPTVNFSIKWGDE